MSARATAQNVLKNCRAEGGWVNSSLKEQLARDRLDRRDAALATRLACGVLQNRALLDHYLQQLLPGRLKDLRPVLRAILHLGLYQILFLDKIPDSAAVNESVDLAKRYCKKQKNAAPLVNGVLRNAVRSRDTLAAPTDLPTKYSHPASLVALLKSYVGENRLEAMLRANNAAPETVIQVNTLKTTAAALMQRLEAEGVEAAPHGWMENCLVLKNTGALESSRPSATASSTSRMPPPDWRWTAPGSRTGSTWSPTAAPPPAARASPPPSGWAAGAGSSPPTSTSIRSP